LRQKYRYGIEICENGAVAFLEAEDDFFAAGKIIKEARTEAFTAENLSASSAQAGAEHAERGSRIE
jgi:hypothetical protein